MKRIMMLLLSAILLFIFVACRSEDDITTEDSSASTVNKITSMDNKSLLSNPRENMEESDSWQNAYAKFLRLKVLYYEMKYNGGMYALSDIDRNGIPELIIAYGNNSEGGHIFANV